MIYRPLSIVPHPLRSGFTILEMAIVLVIISLLITGILSGKALMESSQQQQLISEIGQINAAVATFQSKFDCIPGDCTAPQAKAAGFSNYCSLHPLSVDYSGDGHIALGANEGGNACEHLMFAYHLYQSGLLNLPYDFSSWSAGGGISQPGYITSRAYPTAWIVPGSWSFMPEPAFSNWLIVEGGIWNDSEHMANGVNTQHSTALSPNAAHAIDQKIDDGMPMTGNVQIIGDANGSGSPCETVNASYRGSCLSYGGYAAFSGACSNNNTAQAIYVNSNLNSTPAAQFHGCKVAFKAGF